MEVSELPIYLKHKGEELIRQILAGEYKPQPVKRVEIPKADGSKRELGIPTVIDRLVQQSTAQILKTAEQIITCLLIIKKEIRKL